MLNVRVDMFHTRLANFGFIHQKMLGHKDTPSLPEENRV